MQQPPVAEAAIGAAATCWRQSHAAVLCMWGLLLLAPDPFVGGRGVIRCYYMLQTQSCIVA